MTARGVSESRTFMTDEMFINVHKSNLCTGTLMADWTSKRTFLRTVQSDAETAEVEAEDRRESDSWRWSQQSRAKRKGTTNDDILVSMETYMTQNEGQGNKVSNLILNGLTTIAVKQLNYKIIVIPPSL